MQQLIISNEKWFRVKFSYEDFDKLKSKSNTRNGNLYDFQQNLIFKSLLNIYNTLKFSRISSKPKRKKSNLHKSNNSTLKCVQNLNFKTFI